ncbi:hypothetical protein EZ449_06900 [Pedobacter frigidisoli]|uniref:Uncharacterized protein n=1 Tax=Pedobacter frigidisoli TaxID=2530455 RepID=A0A4R0P2Z5_9SPHI|nr:hypothetical protein [Pedobacter frigidisoli]TCD11213.1 hypothetical protein EZ449_06900 [Pedobacter frigidisoli]
MMNQQDIFRKIGSILTELNEQYQFLAQNPEQLNDLEVELFLANADFLADHVRISQKLNTNSKQKTDSKILSTVEQAPPTIADELKVLQGYKPMEECFDPPALAEVAAAEEEEERVDVQQEQEVLDDEKIKEETAEKILAHDFFKPDHDDHSFEFVLGNHTEDDKFDYEAKNVEEIFDRPLSRAEEEILAQKKKIHEKEESPLTVEENIPAEDDEIGPEPFLISNQEEEAEAVQPKFEEPVVEIPKIEVESKSIEALKDVEMDEPILSPPIAVERPAFTPEAIPVRPVTQTISSTPPPSLNDLLAKTNGKSDESFKAPIVDLKQGISLNEKLLFIKDLFKGYNLAYSEAIDIVNKMNSFEAADGFLQNNYAVKNDWANKQGTVDQFYELLNRRFSK